MLAMNSTSGHLVLELPEPFAILQTFFQTLMWEPSPGGLSAGFMDLAFSSMKVDKRMCGSTCQMGTSGIFSRGVETKLRAGSFSTWHMVMVMILWLS